MKSAFVGEKSFEKGFSFTPDKLPALFLSVV
jgi:hypothetical protein